jgi:hypothetical protein
MHHYCDKLLVKKYNQIVLPYKLWKQVLYLAHDIPAAGHLSFAKTRDRMRPHFYWPKMLKAIEYYCQSCHICQCLGKGACPAPAPLVPLPIKSESLPRIAIDVVGPLSQIRNSENRFILTMFDLATHYPDAIALKDNTAQSVASALIGYFSHFGFADEIMSDRGTDFLSELISAFLHEFDISHLKTAAYHPQTNGSIEIFHRTLKSMIKATKDKFEDSWDLCLPWILFSYREVPVESTGFSPFELLFAHQVRGHLGLLKKQWLKPTKPNGLHQAKPNVLSYMMKIRERLKLCRDIVCDNKQKARSRSKTWYDKKARSRSFEQGDLVMLLLPSFGKPLQAKFQGPYTVIKRMGPVDYKIATPGKRSRERVCHINPLKPYVQREWAYCLNIDITQDKAIAEVDDVDLGPTTYPCKDDFVLYHLDSERKEELTDILMSYKNVFND